MSFKKLKGIEGGPGRCNRCGYQHEVIPVEVFENEDARIGVGFGIASLTKNDEEIFIEEGQDWDELLSYKEAEELAAKEPDQDWRIHLIAPLSERHFQRQGEKHWVLYEKGKGFA